MPAPKSVGVQKDVSLADLETIVQQQEDLLGPLIALGHGPLLTRRNAGTTQTEQDVTVLTFDMDPDPPANKATLRQAVGGHAVALPGLTLISTGQCFVSGQLLTIAAYRPR